MKRILSCIMLACMMIIILALPAAAEKYGKTVLCLYKTSDGYTKDNNPVKLYFEATMTELGLKPVYHDFDSGIPDDEFRDVRAIVTWYNNGVVEKQKIGIKYIEFLHKAIDAGVKLVIVNSFGAYGYKDGTETKWDMHPYFNPLFQKMGFNFSGFWTNDVSKLKIISKIPSMVEKDAKQDLKAALHYQQIRPMRSDVVTYLKLKRTDSVEGLGSGESSVILTSHHGGFALEQYVIRGNKMLLNAPAFFNRALFGASGEQIIGVIAGNFKGREEALANLRYGFRYAKITHEFLDTKQFKEMTFKDLAKYETIVIIAEDCKSFPAPLFEGYVRNGGNLIFARSADLNGELASLLGIDKNNSETRYFKDGFVCLPDFYINGQKITAHMASIEVRRVVLKEVKIICKGIDGDIDTADNPVAWLRTIGRGKILYWNSPTFVLEKSFRGQLVQSIHYVNSGYVTALANIGMMMIDDFPAPWWNINYKTVRLQYYQDRLSREKDSARRADIEKSISRLHAYPNITDTQFIRKTWVKDIDELAKKFGFKYSSYLIFNYNKDTSRNDVDKTRVTDFYLAEDNLSVRMGRAALARGWELGFHGYNHQSLTETRPKQFDSTPWPNKKAMLAALNIARDEWVKIYGAFSLPFSYVAPHNIIDQTGMAALAESFPSIKAACTLYNSNSKENNQEFEWSRDNRFYQIPRISYGYMPRGLGHYEMYDGLHNFGVLSHFIHPDDVFDEDRSNLFTGWEKMKQFFIREFSLVKENYPWLRWMTVKDAFNEFIFYENTNIRTVKGENSLTIYSSAGSVRDIYLRFRLEAGRKIKKMSGCHLVTAYKNGDVVIRTNRNVSRVMY